MNVDEFKLLAENSTDVISRHTPEGDYIYASPSCCRVLGYHPEELIGRSVFELFHPEDLEQIQKAHKKKIETKEAETSTYRILTKDKGYLWVETVSKLILDKKTNEPVEIHAITRDVTQRVELTQKLEEEKRFNRSVIESLPGIFYLIDTSQKFILWNKNLERVLECSASELKEAHPFDFYRPEDKEMILSKITEAFESGSAETEVDVIGKKGTVRRFRITGLQIDISGKSYILGTGIDITDRKNSFDALTRNIHLLNQLFENSPTATVMINTGREILDVNRSFELTFGFTREASIGSNIKDLITPDHLREEHPPGNGNHKRQYESVRHHRDGNLIPVLIGVNPVYIDGKLIAKYISYVDISVRKRHEDAIKVSLQEKSVLLQEVHHRVKNNLALVSGLLNLQKYSIQNSELEQILTDCELQIKSISLIHEKLYESTNLAQINFKSYTEGLFNTIQQVYDPDREVRFQLDSKAIRMNINQAIPVALILNELITNAYKYAFQGIENKTITIRAWEEQGLFHLELCDNGVGLPKEFDFERSSKMGHTIIKTLISQLKADFSIHSDNGTRIRFSFKKRNMQGPGANLM